MTFRAREAMRDHWVTFLAIGGCVALMGLTTLISWGKECSSPRLLTGVVTDKYVKADHASHRHDHFYVTIHEDCGHAHVLRNVDSAWWWKWDSADTQARLRPGRRVTVQVAGWRWPFFSLFPNVVHIVEAK